MQNLNITKPLTKDNQHLTIHSNSETLKQILHLSLSVLNLESIRDFYELNFAWRITKSDQGLHINFFGNQLTFVEVTPEKDRQVSEQNKYDSSLVHLALLSHQYLIFRN